MDRSAWQEAPTKLGVYLLYGFVDGNAAAYVGLSTTSIRDRIRTHHVTPKKNWFGVLFAVPLPSALHCPAIEAEMIRRIEEAGVVPLPDNKAREERWLDAEDLHVAPAVASTSKASRCCWEATYSRRPILTRSPSSTRSRRFSRSPACGEPRPALRSVYARDR